MAKDIEIGGRLHSTATGNVVAGANEVLDDTKNKKQNVINAEVDAAIGDDNTEGTIKGRIKAVENSVETLNGDSSTSGSVAKAVADAKTELIGGATSDGNTLKKVEDRTATLETAVGSNGSVDQRIAAAKSEIIGDAASDYNTLGKLEDKIQAEASARESAVSNEAQARQDAITAETNRATTRENQIYDLVHTPEQHYVTVATYADLANIASPSDDTIYRVSSYNGNTSQVDNTVYSEYGYDGTNFVFLCVKSQIDEVYDISAHHSNNTYVDLAAALDGGNNIPQELRRGGMSVKFVQSSDNKYVQYRLRSDEWSTDTDYWSFCGDDVLIDNPEFIEAKTDSEGKLLEARKIDGTKVEYYDLQVKGNIINEGIQEQIDTVIEEVDERLSDAEETLSYFEPTENPEWLSVTTDSEGKILGGRKQDGTLVENMSQENPVCETSYIDNPEWDEVSVDKKGRIIRGLRKDGTSVGYDNPISERMEELFLAWNGNQISNIYNAARYNTRAWTPHIPNGRDFQVCLASDTHGEEIAAKRAIALTNYVESIMALLLLGDYQVWTPFDGFNNNYDVGGVERLVNSILPSECKKPWYMAIGNHDVGEGRCLMYTRTHEQVYNTFIKPMVDRGFLKSGEYNTAGAWADRCYYFHDFDDTKIRMIVLYEYGYPLEVADNDYWEPVAYDATKGMIQPGTTYVYDENNPLILNSGDYKEYSFKLKRTVTTLIQSASGNYATVPYYKVRARQIFTESQLWWLINTLNSTPDGYGITIVSHQCLMANAHVTDYRFSIGSDPNNTYNPREDGRSPDMLMDNDIVVKIVNAWINKTSIDEKVAALDNPENNQYASYLNILHDDGYDYMYRITVDFSERTNDNAFFSNYINGHDHCDMIERSKLFSNQIAIEATTMCPPQRDHSDCAVVMHHDSQAYDNITVFSCSRNRIALARYGNASTFAGVKRDFEIINSNS